jgi:hypothetical protein
MDRDLGHPCRRDSGSYKGGNEDASRNQLSQDYNDPKGEEEHDSDQSYSSDPSLIGNP